MNWYLKVLQQYFEVSGRARRKEFWMFFLFNMIVASLFGFICGMLHIPEIVTYLYPIAVFIPSIAVTIRRMHDVGKSGAMILIAIIPVIGWIWYLVLLLTDSDPGENKYGQNPKMVTDLT